MRALIWTAGNIGITGMALLAVLFNFTWAIRIFLFLTYVMLGSSYYGFTNKKLRSRIYAAGSDVPVLVSSAFDWLMILFLIGSGWYCTGIAVLVTWAFQYSIYTEDE